MIDMVQTAQADLELINQFQRATTDLREARRLAAENDIAGATRRYRDALTDIGRSYISSGLIDDTSTKLALAESSLSDGKSEIALTLFDRVASARLKLLEARFGGH